MCIRARFPPGLVLGLVIGGVCGAILPTLLEARPKIERSDTPVGESSRERDGEVPVDLDQAAIDEALRNAQEQGEALADDAGDLLDEGAEKVNDALDDVTDPPSDD